MIEGKNVRLVSFESPESHSFIWRSALILSIIGVMMKDLRAEFLGVHIP